MLRVTRSGLESGEVAAVSMSNHNDEQSSQMAVKQGKVGLQTSLFQILHKSTAENEAQSTGF